MIIGIGLALAPFGQTSALTVAEVQKNLTYDERQHYVSGVVEGLAFARWIADDRNTEGMNCIWDWYLGGDPEQVIRSIWTMFDRHPDQQVSTLMYALIREECGE